MDFGGSWDTNLPLVEFSYNNSYHTSIKCAPFKDLYRRKCRSLVIWTKVGESQLIGPEIVKEMTEKIIQIKERLKRQGVARKAMLIRGVSLLNSKLETERVIKESPGPLPQGVYDLELSCIHNTFHVSNLKKCLAEPDVQMPLKEIEIDENLRFVEEPIKIVERDVKKLKRRRIPLVKVHWNSRQGPEFHIGSMKEQFSKESFASLLKKNPSPDMPYPPVRYDVSNLLLRQRIDCCSLNNVSVLPNNTAYSVYSIRHTILQ
ncbi:putative reverse transcriptase domain-containing protein [Tanacetum coccineum]